MQHDIDFFPSDGCFMAGGQLSAIVKERPRHPEPLGVIVGTSTLFFAVDPAQLDTVVRPRNRWQNVTVFGATVCELEPFVKQLFADPVHPGMIVFALELRMLARNLSYRHEEFDDRFEVAPGAVVP